jgi:hypothetical protein
MPLSAAHLPPARQAMHVPSAADPWLRSQTLPAACLHAFNDRAKTRFYSLIVAENFRTFVPHTSASIQCSCVLGRRSITDHPPCRVQYRIFRFVPVMTLAFAEMALLTEYRSVVQLFIINRIL